jgi:hypothetical protein
VILRLFESLSEHAIKKSVKFHEICIVVSFFYACVVNMYLIHTSSQRLKRMAPHTMSTVQSSPVPIGDQQIPPCVSWQHVFVLFARTVATVHSNDPYEAIRRLSTMKHVLKRLSRGMVYLVVTAETFIPSYRVWCDVLARETVGRVSCRLLMADNSTVSAGLDVVRREQPCLASALVAEEPADVETGFLRRLAVYHPGMGCTVYQLPLTTLSSPRAWH